mmetsp:Transcript_26696/g.29828  ORF Transcript_26696/g.29828 Transcript_26696/m.29828 type:complete len:95 (+) Transcript_26696:226-510(+)
MPRRLVSEFTLPLVENNGTLTSGFFDVSAGGQPIERTASGAVYPLLAGSRCNNRALDRLSDFFPPRPVPLSRKPSGTAFDRRHRPLVILLLGCS